MKKIIVFFTVLFLVSCSKNFDKTYKGKIGNKYDIVATLSYDSDKVEGFYFYKSKGQGLRIEGEIDANGNLILQESFEGRRTGVISAKKIGNEINGVWKNPNTGKEFDFSVKEADINYNEVFVETSLKVDKRQNEIDYKKLTGTFTSKIDERSKVEVEYLGNNQLLFKIDVASVKCSMNAYKGIANIINLNKSVFKKGDFELTFIFQGHSLDISSKGSDSDLGMFCYPTGTYAR